MIKNEELLQRCFDTDLNDDEMKKLFFELSKDTGLRNEYRSLQSLQHGLLSIPSPIVPSSLDERIKTLNTSSMLRLVPNRVPLKNIFTRKITLSIPALAATILLMLVGGYIAATQMVVVPKPATEYVYIVEMPAYVVQSNYSVIKNN